MVELELGDHEQTLLDGKLLHFFPLGLLAAGNDRCDVGGFVLFATTLLFPQEGHMV